MAAVERSTAATGAATRPTVAIPVISGATTPAAVPADTRAVTRPARLPSAFASIRRLKSYSHRRVFGSSASREEPQRRAPPGAGANGCHGRLARPCGTIGADCPAAQPMGAMGGLPALVEPSVRTALLRSRPQIESASSPSRCGRSWSIICRSLAYHLALDHRQSVACSTSPRVTGLLWM